MRQRTVFRLICPHCGNIGLRIDDPNGSSQGVLKCSSCDSPRGTLGQLRDASALEGDLDDRYYC